MKSLSTSTKVQIRVIYVNICPYPHYMLLVFKPTLALVLFLISRLLRSLICKYVSFNTGMEHEQHEVVGGGGVGEGEEAQNESVFIG